MSSKLYFDLFVFDMIHLFLKSGKCIFPLSVSHVLAHPVGTACAYIVIILHRPQSRDYRGHSVEIMDVQALINGSVLVFPARVRAQCHRWVSVFILS